jgi:molecular chaperone DnaJ
MKDLYSIIGVDKNASKEDIQKAYRKLAVKYHPDINPQNTEKFKELQDAYETLIDDARRARYDNSGSFGANQRFDYAPFSYEQIINDFFNHGNNRKENKNLVKVQLTLKEAYYGCNKIINFKLKTPCSSCDSTGFIDYKNCEKCSGSGKVIVRNFPFSYEQDCPWCYGKGKASDKKCPDCSSNEFYEKSIDVKIPSGVDSGSYLKIEIKEKINNELFIAVEILQDEIIKKDGLNLIVEVPVLYSQLVLGGEVEVPTIEGLVSLKIPKGTMPNTKMKLKSKGFQNMQKNKGDLIAVLKLQMPEMNDKNKKIIEKFKKQEEKIFQEDLKKWSESIQYYIK